MMRRIAPRIAAALLVALLGLAVSGGCYRHVIRTEGFGNDDINVYEPNSPDPDAVDDLMWGRSSRGGGKKR